MFIPDTDGAANDAQYGSGEFPIFKEGAWNFGLRMALYERAFLNLGVNNGPTCLFLVNDRCKGIMFKILTPGVPQTDVDYLKKLGLQIGGQFPFSTPFQKRVWEDDTFDVIKREFEAMERRIRDHELAQAL